MSFAVMLPASILLAYEYFDILSIFITVFQIFVRIQEKFHRSTIRNQILKLTIKPWPSVDDTVHLISDWPAVCTRTHHSDTLLSALAFSNKNAPKVA